MTSKSNNDIKIGAGLIALGAIGMLIIYGILFSGMGLLRLSNPILWFAITIFTAFCGITTFFGIYIGRNSKREGTIICLIMGIITSITQFIYFDSIPLTLTIFFIRFEPALLILGSVIILTSEEVTQKPLKKIYVKLLRIIPMILLIIFPITIFFYP